MQSYCHVKILPTQDVMLTLLLMLEVSNFATAALLRCCVIKSRAEDESFFVIYMHLAPSCCGRGLRCCSKDSSLAQRSS